MIWAAKLWVPHQWLNLKKCVYAHTPLTRFVILRLVSGRLYNFTLDLILLLNFVIIFVHVNRFLYDSNN